MRFAVGIAEFKVGEHHAGHLALPAGEGAAQTVHHARLHVGGVALFGKCNDVGFLHGRSVVAEEECGEFGLLVFVADVFDDANDFPFGLVKLLVDAFFYVGGNFLSFLAVGVVFVLEFAEFVLQRTEFVAPLG